MSHIRPSSEGIRSLFHHSGQVPVGYEPPTVRCEPQRPFITITAEPGAGPIDLGQRLVDAINRNDPTHWTCWDRELVNKVAAEHQLPPYSVESLENAHHSWFDDLLAGLAFHDDPEHPDMVAVFRRLSQTVRELAERRRVILIGHGAAYITRHLTGGMRVLLVAPRFWRAANLARQLDLSATEAEARLRERERLHKQFLRRFCLGFETNPEHFTVTFNCAALSEDALVGSIAMLATPLLAPVPIGTPEH